jgi:hypothetical protein
MLGFKIQNFKFCLTKGGSNVKLHQNQLDLTVLTKAFHNYGIIIIDKLTLSSVTHFYGFFLPKLILT